ncbi:hypothetical protein [Nannocystis pusilla]|uniref:hypothetical protein n=1 Tax=Nannocystis pusilla TaxID=889268 RepID=UPI003DA44C52
MSEQKKDLTLELVPSGTVVHVRGTAAYHLKEELKRRGCWWDSKAKVWAAKREVAEQIQRDRHNLLFKLNNAGRWPSVTMMKPEKPATRGCLLCHRTISTDYELCYICDQEERNQARPGYASGYKV